ncbi:MAG TPA: hypothetical protein VIM73_19780, partial [Polyangiaceae bacterium]
MHLRSIALALGLGTVTSSAFGQTLPDPDIDCDQLPEPKLFIEAGDTQMTLLGALARKLRDMQQPMTLVYLPRST